MNYLNVEQHANLIRDDNNKAILNTDSESLELYKMRKLRERQFQQVIENYENLKLEIDNIKNALTVLLEKK